MKARVEVTVSRKHIYDFDVDGPGSAGWDQAWEAANDKAKLEHKDASISVNQVYLIEGPLVASVQWSNHVVRDVILACAAIGYRLNEKECDGIRTRLESLGLTVVDRWNVGSKVVSFRANGRDGECFFTEKELNFLCGETRVENLTADELKGLRTS